MMLQEVKKLTALNMFITKTLYTSSDIWALLHFWTSSTCVSATELFPYPEIMASTADTMVMSLAQLPRKIDQISTLFLELDINACIPYAQCCS